MSKKLISIIIALMFLLSSIKTIHAQADPNVPVYIVQPGENLTEIANKFGISVNDLITANQIVDSNLISAGTQLIIPGIEGIRGILNTRPVEFGESLASLLRQYHLSLENFMMLNDVTSPAELYIGSNLILPEEDAEKQLNNSIVLKSQESFLEAALSNNLNPWYLSQINQISGLSYAVPGESLFYFSDSQQVFHSPVSDLISKIELQPLPLVQGHTAVIRVHSLQSVNLSGMLGNYSLNFFHDDSSDFYYALQGIHAMAQPGLIPLKLSGLFDDGASFTTEQMLLLNSGNYANETLTVEQTTIDLATIEVENQQIAQIINPITPVRLWEGPFRFPVEGSLSDNTIGFTSLFGNRRSYNNGQYSGYHGGLDFLVLLVSLNVYAPASGKIIYADKTNIRGNTIFIDHGQGIYSGYAHLKEFNTNPGDMVQSGQLIGIIGETGRVTGPHLHWDIWVNGIPVDPFDWTENVYP